MLITWRLMLSSSMVLMLAALGTAIEMYDEVPPGDMDIMYPENNYVDTAPVGPAPRYEDPIKSLLLYKMLNSLRNRDVSPNVFSGAKWIPLNPALVSPDAFNFQHSKNLLMKRVSDAKITPKVSYKYAERPQQKWKIKKGKGSQMICYFKLCAFRSPL